MRCEVCGDILRNSIITINGVKMCERCARAQTSKDLGALFGGSMLEDELASFFPNMGIDFANQIVTCPKCHSTIRDIETSGRVGCIECFNTFNNTVIKALLKKQGTANYEGRKPGQQLDFDDDNELGVVTRTEEAPVKQEAEAKPVVKKTAEAKKPEVAEVKPTVTEDKYDAIKSADELSSFSDEELNNAIKKAASEEDYPTAIKVRDELKRRQQVQSTETDSAKEDN